MQALLMISSMSSRSERLRGALVARGVLQQLRGLLQYPYADVVILSCSVTGSLADGGAYAAEIHQSGVRQELENITR